MGTVEKVEIGGATLYLGDCMDIIPTLPQVDAVVTDPPYSSGGLMRSDRSNSTNNKYRDSGAITVLPDFSGDNRDQRSFLLWCEMWMRRCLDVTRAGGAMLCFIDWRNLPCLIDAVQVGGWVYRGIVPWDKTEASRPRKGWFRSQCEYIVTASAGALDTSQDADGVFAPGFIRLCTSNVNKRLHVTEKPVELMEYLLGIRGGWDTILDPFMGSGTTGVACARMGKAFIGIEKEPAYFDTAVKRITQAAEEARGRLFAAGE